MTAKYSLISHTLCGFVQRAAIVFGEKKVSYDRVDIDLGSKPNWFLAISPTGKVPMLRVVQEGGERILFESMAICEYLEEVLDGPRLYPDDPLTRAQHRALIEVATGMLVDGWGFMFAKDIETSLTKAQSFETKLLIFEKLLDKGPYFAGAEFGMVDAVVAPIFRYFDAVDSAAVEALFDSAPKAKAWRSALRTRDSVRAAVSDDFADRLHDRLRHEKALIQ